MTEPTPQLHLPREHVMALTMILNQLSSTLAENRRRREQEEQRAAETRPEQRPVRSDGVPVAERRDAASVTPRAMTADERGAFEQRAGDVPDPHPDHLHTTAAPMGEGPEWGVRASLPNGQAAHVVVPDEAAATGLGSTLTQRNEPRDVAALAALTPAGSLAARLPDLPASVVEDPEWAKVEQRFRDRVAGGADPAQLADAVGNLDFAAARFPTSLASWEIDRVADGRGGPGTDNGPGRDADRALAMSQLTDAEADARRERDEAAAARREQHDPGTTTAATADDWDAALRQLSGYGIETDADAAQVVGEQQPETEQGAAAQDTNAAQETTPEQEKAPEQENAAEQVAEHEGRAADETGRGQTLRDGALARSLTPTPEAKAAAAAQRAPGARKYTPPKSAPTAAPTTPLGPRPQRRRFGR